MPNGTYGGVRGRKTKVGRKLRRFPPTRLSSNSKNYFPCSDKYLSASIAALQPLPAAVIAWR